MGKKSKKELRNIPIDVFLASDRIEDANIGIYNSNGMRIFGANVQLARAIPDIIDGLKPLGRRILYAITKIGKADKTMKKINALAGFVIQIHPHGETSAEDALKDFSKEWEYTYPLIDIKGNNGSAKGGEAAASRYLQGVLSKYAYDCYFKEWDDELVEMVPSYNPEYDEPLHLATRFPDLLLRATIGFTYGQATAIPSYNMEEAFNAVIELIKNPKYEPVLIPDMPSDCIIIDEGQFPDICRNGEGTFKMRAEIRIDKEDNALVVESLPYKVALDSVKEKIVSLTKTELPNIVHMFDSSGKYTVELKITFKHGTDLEAMKNFLYKKTELETTFGVNMKYVDNYKIALFNLKEVMHVWINNRRIVKRKYIIKKFVTAQGRISVLNALIDICSDENLANNIIQKIRKSERSTLVQSLAKKYDIGEMQANGILNMKVSGFSKTSLAEYKMERTNLKELVKEYEEYINKPKKIDKIIIKELEEAIRKYNKPRRCRVIKMKKTSSIDSIPNVDYKIIFTKNGFVKKLTMDNDNIGDLNNGDEPLVAIKINNREQVVLFDDKGSIHTVNVYDIPESDTKSKGFTLSQKCRIKGKIISVFKRTDITDKGNFIFVTKNGICKISSSTVYGFKNSVLALVLKLGDRLVDVKYSEKNEDILIYTKKGYGSRFNSNEISPSARLTMGVIGINMGPKDEVQGMCLIPEGTKGIAIFTQKGYGKCCELVDFESTSRRGKVLILSQLIADDEIIEVIPYNERKEFVIIKNTEILELSTDDMVVCSRNHYGKKLIPVRRGETIIRIVTK